jgi:putative oxidoreductase
MTEEGYQPVGRFAALSNRDDVASQRVTQGESMIDHRTAPYAALFLRLSLSFLFFAHIYRKFAIIGFDPWWAGLQKAGYADWMLSYTLVAEFAGAVLLLLGIYTRYVSVFAMPVMIALVYHWAIRKGFWFSDGGLEFVLAWLMMLIAQALLGDGAYAVRVPALPWETTHSAAGRVRSALG